MASRMQTDTQTYTHVLQCSHASVGLAQARPNNKGSFTFGVLVENGRS